MPNKYFIYAGGRWCEVDLRRGRVEGFRQRARFCYLRGGRLEVGRTATVLRALRALAAGNGGAARDSAPLPYRRPHKSRRDSARAHRCCSQHLHHSRCDVNANELGAMPPVQPPESTPRKRKRSISEESHSKAKQLKTEENETKSPQKLASTRDREQECVKNLLDDKEKSPQNKIVKVRGKEEAKLVQSLLQTSSSDDFVKEQKKAPQNKPGPRSRKKQILDETRSESPKKPQKEKVVRGKEEKLVQLLLQSSSDDKQVAKTSPKPTPQLKPDSDDSDSSSESKEAREMCKELVIDDRDVRLLRGFLGRSAGGEELERFDKDEEYKTRVFYKLNPLVCLKRCGPLERLLTQRLTLKEFARHLGLRSVADVTPEKRYRMRHSTRQARNVASITSDSGKEKDAVQPKKRQLWNRDKEVFSQSPRSSEIKVKPQIHRPARDSSRDTTDSDTEIKQHIRRHLERRASAKLNPERKEAANKKDDSIFVESESDETSTDDKQRKTRRHSKATKKDDKSVVVRDEDSNNTDGKQRITSRKAIKEGDESVVVSDSSDNVDQKQMKSKTKTRAKSRRSSTDDKQRKTGHRSRATKKNDESVVVSDENSSSIDGKRKVSRRRSKGIKEDDESVLVSDSSNSVDQKQTKSRTKTRTKSKNADGDESAAVSDESNDSDSSNDENAAQPTRRTRSHGPEERLLRNRNQSVIISDTDSNTRDRKTRTNTKETDKMQSKAVVVSNSNTNEKQDKNGRNRSRGPNRTLKDNKTNNSEKKGHDKKTRDEDSSTEIRKTTRSSMKLAETESKGKSKAEASKKEEKSASSKIDVTNKRKEEKPGPSRKDVKVNSKKAETDRGQDKSVISDSSDAFDTSKNSPKKDKKIINVSKDFSKRVLALNRDRGHKGRFLKQDNRDHKNKTTENQKQTEDREKTGQRDKNKEKDRTTTNTEADKDRNKVLRDRIEDKEEGKGSDSKKTENKGKENSRKAAAVRSMFVKPVKFRKSSVANGREYTSLEDHAIVAWVSVGNRERMVNGNAIWRELQSEYTRLTSQTRSWHSLRNRYLRYILPALGQLALPPAQVSRLRAAAAVGMRKPDAQMNCQEQVNKAIVTPRVDPACQKETTKDNPNSRMRKPDAQMNFQEQVNKAMVTPRVDPACQKETTKDNPNSSYFKSKSRRNSIFKQQQVLSAASAGRLRFRPVSSSDSDDASENEKAPTPPSPRRRPPASSPKLPPSPSKASPSPSKAPPSPSKPASPTSPRATRLRARSSTASAATPKPKKKRIHHL